jgi:TRAP-type C4-dicarboxylate transport system permease small subunit
MRRFVQVIETVNDFLSGQVQGILLFLLMCLVLVDVATRYLLQNPLSIAEEYGAYMLVAITCLGLAYTWKEKTHVRIEVLVDRLSLRAQRVLRLITLLMAFLFTLFMIPASYQLVSFSFMFGTRSGGWLRTPIAWPQIPILIGALLLFFQLIVEIIKAVKALQGDKKEVS